MAVVVVAVVLWALAAVVVVAFFAAAARITAADEAEPCADPDELLARIDSWAKHPSNQDRETP